MQRFPQETTATIEDFRLLDWQAITAAFEEEGYPAIWSSLSAVAKDAIERGEFSKGKVLWLLADACSMMLHPESQNEPFKPLTWLSSSRSAVPDDFTEADFALIAEIAAEVQNNWIKARLADLVWLCKKQRRAHEFALIAINAYKEVPLNIASWSRGGRDCWERAIALAKTLRTAAGSRLGEIEADLLDALKSADTRDRHLAKGISDLLYKYHLASDHGADVAAKLETLAQAFERGNEFGRSRELFAAAAKWYRRATNNLKFAEMTSFEAETWVKEVAARTLGGQGHIAAATFIGNAIQTYRTIPHSERDAYKVEERLVKLQLELRSAGQNTIKRMHTVSSDPINLLELAEKARKKVAGKTAEEALLTFANLYSGAQRAKLMESSQETLRQSVFRTLFSSTYFFSRWSYYQEFGRIWAASR